MKYWKEMTINNSKHTIAKRTTEMSQYYIPLLALIDTISGVSSIWWHVTTLTSVILYMHLK